MRSWDRLYIGGEWVEPSSTKTIEVISPHTTEVIATAPEAVEADVDRAVTAARTTFDQGDWALADPKERHALVKKLHDLYTANMGDLATLMTEEIGSPITFSQMAQTGAAWMTLNSMLGHRRELPVGGAPPGRPQRGARASRGGRRGRRRRAVERAAVHHHEQDRSRPCSPAARSCSSRRRRRRSTRCSSPS